MYMLNKQLSIQFVNYVLNTDTLQSVVVPLYDSLDLVYLSRFRKQLLNHKLFIFRDWENLAIRMHLRKTNKLMMSDLPAIANESPLYKSQKLELIRMVTGLITKSPRINEASLRIQDEMNEMDDKNTFNIN